MKKFANYIVYYFPPKDQVYYIWGWHSAGKKKFELGQSVSFHSVNWIIQDKKDNTLTSKGIWFCIEHLKNRKSIKLGGIAKYQHAGGVGEWSNLKF